MAGASMIGRCRTALGAAGLYLCLAVHADADATVIPAPSVDDIVDVHATASGALLAVTGAAVFRMERNGHRSKVLELPYRDQATDKKIYGHGSHLLLTGFEGAVFQSNDEGRSWTRIGVARRPFEFDPMANEQKRAIDRDGVFYVCHDNVVHIGEQGGVRWKRSVVGQGSSGFDCDGLAASSEVVYVTGMVGNARSLFRSRDHGASWTRVRQAEGPGSAVERHAALTGIQHGVLYANEARSKDGGVSWEPYRFGLPYGGLAVQKPDAESRLLVIHNTGTSPYGTQVHLSLDGKPARRSALSGNVQYRLGEDGVIYALSFVIRTLTLQKSTDDGATWTPVNVKALTR